MTCFKVRPLQLSLDSTASTNMDFDELERPTWGVISPQAGEGNMGLVRETVRKEQAIKCV